MIVTRFAPSPNGSLHLGHAFSAIVSHDLAREADGRFLLRIEDIDGPRSRPELADEFRRDLEWLGLEWDEVAPQSQRLESYRAAAARLRDERLLYPCRCSRTEIAAAATMMGDDGPVYPGTCRGADVAPQDAAWRLDAEAALARTGPLMWSDRLAGDQWVEPGEDDAPGDVVLVRRDLPASYHLAATLDDAADGVTLVTRGADLFGATHVHRLLQAVLDLPVPRWHHHALLTDDGGRKLAKRRGSPSLADRRRSGENGRALADLLRRRHLPAGIGIAPYLSGKP